MKPINLPNFRDQRLYNFRWQKEGRGKTKMNSLRFEMVHKHIFYASPLAADILNITIMQNEALDEATGNDDVQETMEQATQYKAFVYLPKK